MAIDDAYIPVRYSGATSHLLPSVETVSNQLVTFLQEQRPIAARVCLETLFAVATDPHALSSSRVGAARSLGEFAGVLGVRGAAGAAKDPESMSTSELHSQVEALERALADRARIVQNQADHLTQLIDLA